jgi:hypothetical protein
MVATRNATHAESLSQKPAPVGETCVDISDPIDDDDIVIEIDDCEDHEGREEAGVVSPEGARVENSNLDEKTLDAIVSIFASTKGDASTKNKQKSTASANAVVWKPDVSLPQRRPEAVTGLRSVKRGNSYRTLETAGVAHPPPSKKEMSKEWFKLPTQEITDEVKADLRVLRLRSAFDTKRFYRKDDTTKFPTQFHVGRVVEHASDFYGGRLTKKQRQTTMAEEVMHDVHLSAVRRKRFNKIQDEATYWSKKGNKGRKTSNPRLKKKPGRKKH